MIKYGKALAILFVFVSNHITAQTRVMVANKSVVFKSYESFEDSVIKIIPKYKYLKEVDNLSIPNLMASILSEANQEWGNFNTLGGEKNATRSSTCSAGHVEAR
jgi:hypothetical protein